MNKETALSLAFASKSADSTVRVLIDRTPCWMCVCALRVLAGSAILALDSARALPRKLLSCCICRHGVFGCCRARGCRCIWWRHHGQEAWVWNEQHTRRWYSRRSRQAASRRRRRRFEKSWHGRRRFHHPSWSSHSRWWRWRWQPRHHARKPSSEPCTVWQSHPCLRILGREYHAST